MGEVESVKACLKKFKLWNEDILSLDSENEFFNLEDDGEFYFIILQFSLKKSHYATMAIREFLHNDVSFKNQCLIKDIIIERFNDNLEISRIAKEKERVIREEKRMKEEEEEKKEKKIKEEKRIQSEKIYQEKKKMMEEKISN